MILKLEEWGIEVHVEKTRCRHPRKTRLGSYDCRVDHMEVITSLLVDLLRTDRSCSHPLGSHWQSIYLSVLHEDDHRAWYQG
jgi:hypothetical protein